MRKTHYPKTRGRRQYAGLILSVCTAIGLSGWSACPRKPVQRPVAPRPSPIRVSDGSMVVRTNSPDVKLDSSASTNVLTISGGQACKITFGNPSTSKNVTGQDWTISSSDNKAKVSTRSPGGAFSGGKTIYVTGPDAQQLNSDPFKEGPGYEFGVEQVKFSPATASGAGLPPSLDCDAGKALCKVEIDYQPTCPSPPK